MDSSPRYSGGLQIIFFFSKTIKAQNLNLIQDAEIELYIREWIEPIIKVAGLNPDAVNVYIVNVYIIK